MTESKLRLSSTEKYIVWLMFIIAAVFILLQVLSILSSRARVMSVSEGNITMNATEVYSFIRVGLSIVISLSGAFLFIRLIPLGWSISFAVLSVFTLILSGILYANFATFESAVIIGIAGIFILLLGIGFLFRRSTRQKFRVGKNRILIGLLLFLFLSVFYFFLQ